MAVNRENLKQRIAESGEVLIKYTGCKAGTITIPGPVSGRGYHFSKFKTVVPVIALDADGLVSLNVLERYTE
ncbi:MAG: hypothetical protein H8D67_04410 [Deltaproteobacteria bacterium]|nr:hypothetical protein [Deltaproteobacteria bacterium]